MPLALCTVCALPDDIRNAVHDLLRGDAAATPPRAPLSSPKVAAWLEKTHQRLLKHTTLNEHLRRGHAEDVRGAREKAAETAPAQESGPKPKRRKPAQVEKAEERPPPPDPQARPEGGEEVPKPPPVAPAPLAAALPLAARQSLTLIDPVLVEAGGLFVELSGTVRQRMAQVPADVTETPGEEAKGRGREKAPRDGPTEAEAKMVTGLLAGIANLVKARHLIVTGGKTTTEDAATSAGSLKQFFNEAGLPPPPPPIEGDDEAGDDPKGYEAASPDPPPLPAPAPPPSGPRSPSAPPPPTPIRAAVGGWGGVGGAAWKPPARPSNE